jgi:hypothetical protein
MQSADKDNNIYMHKGKTKTDVLVDYVFRDYGTSAGGKKIGELGKTIDANEIYQNLVNEHIIYAGSKNSPFAFKKLVNGKGEWDLKNNMNTIYGLANSFDKGKTSKTEFSFDGSRYSAEDLGNHHYGATGKAWNFFLFTEEVLLRQAGKAQMAAGTSKREWQTYETIEVSAGHGETRTKTTGIMLPPYGDDPHDQDMIKMGFKYYDKVKK